MGSARVIEFSDLLLLFFFLFVLFDKMSGNNYTGIPYLGTRGSTWGQKCIRVFIEF